MAQCETLLSLADLQKLILFCKKENVQRFSYHGFTFELSNQDPNESKLQVLASAIDTLNIQVTKLMLQAGLTPRKVA